MTLGHYNYERLVCSYNIYIRISFTSRTFDGYNGRPFRIADCKQFLAALGASCLVIVHSKWFIS